MTLFLQIIIFLSLTAFARLSWRKTEWGVYLIVFLLPAYLIRTAIFGVPTTLLELGIYLLFIIWLAKNYRSVKLREIIPNKTLQVGIFLLLAGAVISTIFSHDLRASAGILKGWFLDPFLFFIILSSVIKTAEQKENVLKTFFASGLAVAAVSLIYWLAPSLGGVSYDGRLHGFYSSPNYLAMYLAPALLVGLRGSAVPLFLLSSAKDFLGDKYFWPVSSAVIAIALYFTLSYAAWVSLFIAIVLLLYFTANVNKKPSFLWKLGFLNDAMFDLRKGLVLIAVVFLIFTAAILSQSGTSKFSDFKNLSYRSSYNSRLMIWRAAWEIGKDNPFVGIGPGNFQKYYLDYQSRVLGTEPYLEWAVPQPHNIFLAFWLQTGILGLAGFITLVFWFFKKGFGSFKKTGNAGSKGLAIVLCSIMIYTLLHGFVDTTYWKNDLAIIFWMILGLTAAVKNDTGKIF